MVSKEKAIAKVEKYISRLNNSSEIYVFKIPVYTNWVKKIKAFFLKKYWKLVKKIPLDYPEHYIKPDNWIESKAIQMVPKEFIEDLGVCWSIPYCTKLYYEQRNSRFGAIGGGPIYVDKENGKMYETGSAPIDWLDSFKKYKNGTKEDGFPKWKPFEI